ncbi:MAG: phosphoribulokinase [Gammaproteobacteria bacterium]|nr:phosphoribulokinase [Gammaproteobacteria bacterium]MBU1655212.1 phosphoribulokinase [Gammaproteobacteria bacterium]MBU1960482.1 phosphoribulokinase [Gammaproteobacteria bacterium]
MSKMHPVVVVTGSSGAGTTTVKRAFEHIFYRDGVKAAVVEGDSFHRYTRAEMKVKTSQEGLSHFGDKANCFDKLEDLFKTYGENGSGQKRYYIHSPDEAAHHNQRLGTNVNSGEFTPWEAIEEGTDLLFYEGLHGLAVTNEHDVARHVDLGVGVVPIVNLEWIQKIHRDSEERGYSEEAIVDTIMRRMPDYIKHITPQFSRTDINFQRVPTVDTSNPFVARDIPTPDESLVVIRFADPKKFDINFPYLLSMLHNSFMSRRNDLVIPGGKMGMAMEIILQPIIERMMDERRA